VKKLLAMMFVCLALLTACSSTSSSSDSLTSSTESESDASDPGLDTSWTPAGFNEWDDNVAWKWVERESDCSDCIYWHIQIVTNMGCPNGVYSSINISENDEVVDWTNDSIPYLGPGQKAVLAFEKYGLSGSGSDYEGSLTELNCR
jgi:major membrane immunogen (membrane-anchored lipoprotein)